MTVFFQTIVNGLTTGLLYALIALGYTMVYGILKLLNFAHGDVYMVGAYIGYVVLQIVRRLDGAEHPGAAAGGDHVPRGVAPGVGSSAWPWSASPTARCETRRGSRR